MNNKKELVRLVELLKTNAKKEGVKVTNEGIAKRLKITRTYLQDLLSENGKLVSDKLIDDFKVRFSEELAGEFKPSAPGDPLNRERAMIKAYRLRIAKLESIIFNKSIQECLDDLDSDTTKFQNDLERGG